MSGFHIDRFSSLDDLPKGKRAPMDVLAVLATVGRFSCFEASEYRWIATAVDYLFREKYIVRQESGYPWVEVKITDKGQAALKGNGE